MNMSLKITNRDKILLVLLAVILFAGMMYVYGIMPTNSEIETLEKQITEKCADTADHKRRDRIEQYRRKADNDIVKIQMSAGNGNAERAQSDVHRHKDCGGA